MIMIKNIRGFWSWSFVLHLTTFIVVGVYLVLINILYAPGFAWSAISLAGWGIGLGLHLIIASMLRNKKIALIEVENRSIIEAKL